MFRDVKASSLLNSALSFSFISLQIVGLMPVLACASGVNFRLWHTTSGFYFGRPANGWRGGAVPEGECVIGILGCQAFHIDHLAQQARDAARAA